MTKQEIKVFEDLLANLIAQERVEAATPVNRSKFKEYHFARTVVQSTLASLGYAFDIIKDSNHYSYTVTIFKKG